MTLVDAVKEAKSVRAPKVSMQLDRLMKAEKRYESLRAPNASHDKDLAMSGVVRHYRNRP